MHWAESKLMLQEDGHLPTYNKLSGEEITSSSTRPLFCYSYGRVYEVWLLRRFMNDISNILGGLGIRGGVWLMWLVPQVWALCDLLLICDYQSYDILRLLSPFTLLTE